MNAETPDDAGMTIVELLIAAFVGAVVLGLVATIFVTTLQANAATRDRDLATGRAQAISTSLSTSVRTANAVDVRALTDGGVVVRARVTTGTSGWECRAWAVTDLETWDAAGRRTGADSRLELRAHTYAPLGATASVPAPATAWGVLAERVERTAPATPFFSISGTRLSWNLAIVAAEQPQLNESSEIAVSGSAVALARQEGEPSRCW